MANLDPVTGPLSREEFKAAVEAPFGQAVKMIRKHDPLYGLAEGEKATWDVHVSGHLVGIATVKAATKQEAEALAAELIAAQIEWEDYGADIEVESVEPRSR